MTYADLNKAEICLMEMSKLLISNNSSLDWAKKLQSLSEKKTMHSDDFRLQIKRMFGGMGSLNDIVICDSNGKIDRDANIKFDYFRKELYESVSNLI